MASDYTKFCLPNHYFPDKGQPGICFYNEPNDWFALNPIGDIHQELQSEPLGVKFDFTESFIIIPTKNQQIARDNIR